MDATIAARVSLSADAAALSASLFSATSVNSSLSESAFIISASSLTLCTSATTRGRICAHCAESSSIVGSFRAPGLVTTSTSLSMSRSNLMVLPATSKSVKETRRHSNCAYGNKNKLTFVKFLNRIRRRHVAQR